MIDFTHIQTEQDDTKTYTFYTKAGPMNLKVRRAGENNRKYFNEVLKRNKHLAHRRVRIDASLISENRKQDYELYPKFVITGWDGVVDAKGLKVPFSEDDCRAFLRAIGDDAFDDLRKFCDDYTNFDREDVGATSGNSQNA